MKKIKGITIDEEIIKFLEKEAKKRNRSFSNLVNMILKKEILRFKREGEKT